MPRLSFKKNLQKENISDVKRGDKTDVPSGMWVKCPSCKETVYRKDVISNFYACPKCGNYFRISARIRIRMVADRGTFKEADRGIAEKDPLGYEGYPEKLTLLKTKYRIDEAIMTGTCEIHGQPCAIGVMDARFLMGSMGYVVGEKVTRLFEMATERKLPVIMFACSGGARMQEGMVSLMQMAKTSAAVKKHSDAGLFYLSVLTDPTTGGVTASFAMLGDIILAEPGALVGFAGPRVIEQTIGQKLPKGFQRTEYQIEHGCIDGELLRENAKDVIWKFLAMHSVRPESGLISEDIIKTAKKPKCEKDAVSAWERVRIARSKERISATDYIENIFSGVTELKGDRHGTDDRSVIGGIAWLDKCPVTVIGIQKGRNTKEQVKYNFGMPSPEGYRKALRLMKQADKFGRPIVCFVDTPGAYPGKEAEEHNQGGAIAENIAEMSGLSVPVLSVIIGEGGSGGALALAVGNEVWMMENAMYSILSPEGFSSILWKDARRAEEAAGVMKITAADLYEMGVIDEIIPEDVPAIEENIWYYGDYMKKRIRKFLAENLAKSPEILSRERYLRFRKY